MKLIIAAVLILMLCSSIDAKTCRALALSGGGDKGAYEAAVYVGLVNALKDKPEDVAYDVITGVSAGSLNTLGLSVFEPNDVVDASDFVFALWNSVPQHNAYGNWPLGIVQGLFWEKGIFDLSPGIQWVTEQLGDRTLKRKVSFATTDANGADYSVYDYNATYTQPKDLIESAFASSSIPAAFPHITRGDKELIDGGVIWNIDIASAIRRCKEVVDDDKDIIVDMVLCGDHKIEKRDDVDRYSTLEHLKRGMEIKSFYNGMSDYNSSIALFPDVTFRYLVVPSENLSSGLLPLDFSQAQVDKCFRVGKKDAANAVKLGHGKYGKIALEYVERLWRGEDVILRDMIEAELNLIDGINNQASS
jgi:predicted acylesterase/phospholipase RssA